MRLLALSIVGVLAAAQPAAACEIKPFTAYFDPDGIFPAPEFEAVLDETVRLWRTLSDDRKAVMVRGHTDTAGDTDSNHALSLAVAQCVRADLIDRGVPPNVITVEAYGETQPAVATGDGVAESLNRRVEIDMDYDHDCFPGSHNPPDLKVP